MSVEDLRESKGLIRKRKKEKEMKKEEMGNIDILRPILTPFKLV